jgi:hypothetical protein
MDQHLILSLFHIFAVVPLFLYVALSRANTMAIFYPILLGLGAFIFVYHAYKAFIRYKTGSAALWVNLFHMLLVAPLLGYIGYYGKDTPRPAYELLALLAFSALGYHIYSLILSTNVIMDGEMVHKKVVAQTAVSK